MLATDEPGRRHANGHILHPTPANSLNQIRVMPQPEDLQHIWIITGPAGCGKTTVAQFLAKQLDLPYIEGDDVRVYWS